MKKNLLAKLELPLSIWLEDHKSTRTFGKAFPEADRQLVGKDRLRGVEK